MATAGYDVLKTIKKFRYKPPKFSADYGSVGLSSGSNVLINRYQPYGGGSGPIMLNSGSVLNGLIRLGTAELMEDVRITGGFRIGSNLKDNEWMMSYQNYKRRIDWGVTYYRNVVSYDFGLLDSTGNQVNSPGKIFTNLYQVNVSYPFDATKSIRLSTGIRSDNAVIVSNVNRQFLLGTPNQRTLYSTTHLEYVYDNSLNPAMNIWNGLRYKFFIDWNRQINKVQFADGPNTFNLGFDARYYYPIYRNFIWAGRAAGDFSWGNQKMIYYLGGVDGWLMFGENDKYDANGVKIKERYFNTSNPPDNNQDYAFQSLAVNMRGYIQNVANGNNAVVINSEFRLPIVSTFFNRTINNAFLNNFQIIQFIDLGTAWNGAYDKFKRPEVVYGQPPVQVKVKAGGLGPFAGGYGFGARSTLLGYFVKFDAGWPMSGFFKGKPVLYVALGLDF
ncbi:MAG: hypothetical protein IPL50_08160 [Chitinophagaceae bacterium]|nr:hypothetical protein [Chitinophagaceae bacterium]